MSTEPEISHIGVKIPPLWKNNINLWFIQVESSFTLSKITSDTTKYHTIISSIDAEALTTVSDIVLNPPADNKYLALKQRLIAEYSDSETKQIKKLLSELQLGDLRPSHLLRQMKQLAATKISDDFLKSLWLSRLPQDIQTILSVSNENLDGLSILADKVSEVKGKNSYSICSAESNPHKTPVSFPPASECSELEKGVISPIAESLVSLKKEIAKLSEEVRALSRNVCKQNRSHSRGRRSVSRFRKHTEDNTDDNICYFHTKFGENAKRCILPCSFKDEKN